jgi:hypothetical protein
MRSIINTVFIAIATYLTGFFETWWFFTPVVFVISFFNGDHSGKTAFFAGFIGVGAVWCIAALYIDQRNEALLSERIANLFELPYVWLIYVITGLIGGMTGGLSALCGKLFRDIFRKRKSLYY